MGHLDNRLLISLLTIFSLLPAMLGAQPVEKKNSSADVYDHYDRLYRVDARLISGDFYQQPHMSESSGHPYFLDPGWKKGSVCLDGVLFENLLLRYDISSDQIVLNTSGLTGSFLQLVIKNGQIEYFTMNGALFKPFTHPLTMTGTGFCQVLVDDGVKLLLLKSKNLKVTAGGISDFVYQLNRESFLEINGEIKKYRGRNSAYRLFPELKPQLKDFIRVEKLSFRRMNMEDHRKLIEYCNTLLEGGK